jgi:glucuronate isomerase
MAFQRKRFLGNRAAEDILAQIETLPVYDIHTHVDLKLVLDNEVPTDPWQALCGGDHYVSSIMESLGSMDRETFYDPATDSYQKWEAYARIFPGLIGNQVRDWMRLTLESLGIDKKFNPANAQAIWDELTRILSRDRWRPVEIFRNSKIRRMSTTDNPVDSLDQIKRSKEFFEEGYWIPAWRPDPFFTPGPGPDRASRWKEWVTRLEEVTGQSLAGHFQNFLNAFSERHEYFAGHGCRASDYGVSIPAGHDVEKSHAANLFEKACREESLDRKEALDFQAFMLRYSMQLDYDKGWISQIHYGAARNQREVAKELGGADTGCDTIQGYPDVVHSLNPLLNYFDHGGSRQHKILIYSLSRSDWEKIAGLSRIFPSVYVGMAWWYFDSVSGMLEYYRSVPDMGAGFLKTGPFVTDARNIFSLIPRTQVYRRCLATVLGEMVELRGENLEETIALGRYLCEMHPRRLLGED